MDKRTEPSVVRLDDFGDVMSLDDVARLIQRSRRYMDELVQAQRETGVNTLPVAIPGMKHRYTKESVARWLKTGFARPQRRPRTRRHPGTSETESHAESESAE